MSSRAGLATCGGAGSREWRGGSGSSFASDSSVVSVSGLEAIEEPSDDDEPLNESDEPLSDRLQPIESRRH